MGKRIRLINDPSDLVPLLRTFGSRTHKSVFDDLSNEWMTKEELEVNHSDVMTSLIILKKSGLIESRWRMPEPGNTPDKEYHISYSKAQANFQCTIEDLSDLIMMTFKNDDSIYEFIESIENEVKNGNQSMAGLSRALDKNPMYIRGAAKRSLNLSVKGQRIEYAGTED